MIVHFNREPGGGGGGGGGHSKTHLTLCFLSSVFCLFWCLYMMTMAMMKKPMLAKKISITGTRRDHTNDV